MTPKSHTLRTFMNIALTTQQWQTLIAKNCCRLPISTTMPASPVELSVVPSIFTSTIPTIISSTPCLDSGVAVGILSARMPKP